jgi:hypothetical protein
VSGDAVNSGSCFQCKYEFARFSNNFHAALGELVPLIEFRRAGEKLGYLRKLNLQTVDSILIHMEIMSPEWADAL